MSLNKKLRRFFHEVRREARRNAAFSARLENALDAMRPDDLVEDDADETADLIVPEPDEAGADDLPLDVNPVAIVRRDGADALREALCDIPETALRGLIAEHNLDPAGETGRLARDALVGHIVRSAEKRISRDRKLFDY